ncbi:EcsC family protein [Curtobacterium sp. 9128]|uniref:EcsC family protein n=1 Tax=Curtobacterium sp. 9128 TaxID=1793722 RepID=UPI0021B26242|nr:EcsC family protein [Curtobacterium sp. 9128]
MLFVRKRADPIQIMVVLPGLVHDEQVFKNEGSAVAGQMSPYEQKAWQSLLQHWEKRGQRRVVGQWASAAIDRGAHATSEATGRVVRVVPEMVKKPIRQATSAVTDAALKPALESAVALLELVNTWALELNDPKVVVKLAQKRDMQITDFTELSSVDLKSCDRLLSMNTLQWRTAGAAEGAAMGALALVPIAGLPAAITADILVLQVLSTAIAARVAYSYGFDAKDPDEQAFIQRLVRRSFMAQAAKAGPLREASRAAQAAQGRINWSAKLRADHRLLAAIEKIMKHLGPSGAHVSVQSAAKFLPVVGILIGAGVNSTVLANVAEDAKRYCQTRFLSEKYGLPLPAGLAVDPEEEPVDATEEDDDAAPETAFVAG